MKNNKKVEFMEEVIEIETRKMGLMSLTTDSNPTIPFDLLTIEILTRLPAKSLIRFKTISKQFLSTISSRKFINLHAQRSNTNNLNHGVLIETRWSPIFKEGSVVLWHDNKLRVTFDHYKFPISKRDEAFTILGSCNGLVCLWNCCNGTICIWNPVTKEQRYVPKPSMIATSYVYDINPGLWGLSYLPCIDDHKVVNLNLCSSQDKIRFQVSVHTFRTNNWNQYMVDPLSLDVVENLRFNPQYVLGIVLSNNVSHWLMYKWKAATGGMPFILAFDMVTETFNEVPLPQDITNSTSNTFFNFNLSRVKDNLCVEAEYRSVRSQVLYRIVWELKRYRKWGSWEKIIVLCVEQDCVETKDIHELDSFATNIYNESYQFLMYMLQSGGWVIYQRNDGRHKCIQLDKLHCGRLVCSHVNTLVSPFVGLETN